MGQRTAEHLCLGRQVEGINRGGPAGSGWPSGPTPPGCASNDPPVAAINLPSSVNCINPPPTATIVPGTPPKEAPSNIT